MEAIRYRSICRGDEQMLRQIHLHCFPILYESNFFSRAVRGDMYSLAAVVDADGRPYAERAPANSQTYTQMGVRPSATALAYGESFLSYSEDRDHFAGVIIADICSALQFEREGMSILVPMFGSPPTIAYICTLGVLDDFRCAGIAQTLLEGLLHYVDEHPGISAVCLHVITTNAPAIRFYEKNGFVCRTELADFYSIDNVSHSAYLMIRSIPQPPPLLRRLARGAMHHTCGALDSLWSAARSVLSSVLPSASTSAPTYQL